MENLQFSILRISISDVKMKCDQNLKKGLFYALQAYHMLMWPTFEQKILKTEGGDAF
jgi:hypothetical protein